MAAHPTDPQLRDELADLLRRRVRRRLLRERVTVRGLSFERLQGRRERERGEGEREGNDQ